ncbi:hypothetical protein [Thiohalorhabdus methylotrophus]|uniref:Uncharacterized protein n=1 Tax=Thiohalorhabdus methylotrophus TaxID=3242694 RepID=A0ABV4TYN1_9GAMM
MHETITRRAIATLVEDGNLHQVRLKPVEGGYTVWVEAGEQPLPLASDRSEKFPHMYEYEEEVMASEDEAATELKKMGIFDYSVEH